MSSGVLCMPIADGTLISHLKRPNGLILFYGLDWCYERSFIGEIHLMCFALSWQQFLNESKVRKMAMVVWKCLVHISCTSCLEIMIFLWNGDGERDAVSVLSWAEPFIFEAHLFDLQSTVLSLIRLFALVLRDLSKLSVCFHLSTFVVEIKQHSPIVSFISVFQTLTNFIFRKDVYPFAGNQWK